MCPQRGGRVRRAQRGGIGKTCVRERERERESVEPRHSTAYRRRPTFADLLSSFQWFPPPCVRVRVYSYTRGRPRMWPVIELFNFSRHPRRACLLSPAVSTNYLATEITSSQISPYNAALLHPRPIRNRHSCRSHFPSTAISSLQFEHLHHFLLNFIIIIYVYTCRTYSILY